MTTDEARKGKEPLYTSDDEDYPEHCVFEDTADEDDSTDWDEFLSDDDSDDDCVIVIEDTDNDDVTSDVEDTADEEVFPDWDEFLSDSDSDDDATSDVDQVVAGFKTLRVKPKTSKETHLLDYYKDIKRGLKPKKARKRPGTARYASLMCLRKFVNCPYSDDKPELRKAWKHFKKRFPVTPKSDAFYLKQFGKAYTKNPDLDKARGTVGCYKFNALKKIVDEDVKFRDDLPGDLPKYERLLKKVWSYKPLPWKENSYFTHLEAFHKEYEAEWFDFQKARGPIGTARYGALLYLKDQKADKYKEPHRTMILNLQKVWETPDHKTWKEHLRDFDKSYRIDGDFKKARGNTKGEDCARYYTLLSLNNVLNLDWWYDEPYRSMIRKLQEVWEGREVEDLKTWKEHLEDFDESYRTSKNFKEARGKSDSARYDALNKLNKIKDLSEYDEPYRSMIRKLQEVWETPEVTTWEEHLEDFTISYQTDGDFKKARGKRNSGRYEMLNKLRKENLSKYAEPHRSMIRNLQKVWETPGHTTWEEHLEDFDESYRTDGDFKKARGLVNSTRYNALTSLLRDLNGSKNGSSGYEEPYRRMLLNLQKLWKTHCKTWKEYLEDFHESYRIDGDFKKARGKTRGKKGDTARYLSLIRLKRKKDLSKYKEPHRTMIVELQRAWDKWEQAELSDTE